MRVGWMLIILTVASAYASAEEIPRMALISVTGTHEMDVAPDEIKISINIDNREKLLKTAKAKTDEQAKKLIALTKANEIQPKDVVTSYVTVVPIYSYRKNEGRTIEYFQAGQRIMVTLHDFSKYDSLMDSLIQEGLNNVTIRYDLANMPEYRKKARINAILAAQDKAKLLAEAIGQKIGKAYTIKELSQPDQQVFPLRASSFLANTVSSGGNRSEEDAESSPLSIGNISIKVTVEVSFILE